MRLIYQQKEKQKSVEIKDELTIGRSSEADLQIEDETISRIHCSIRKWGDEYYVKDMGSRNGTSVNGTPIDDVTRIASGDTLRVGSFKIQIDVPIGKGTETILHEVEEEMQHGKGYNTILREILDDTDKK